jgi:hypothetical protein
MSFESSSNEDDNVPSIPKKKLKLLNKGMYSISTELKELTTAGVAKALQDLGMRQGQASRFNQERKSNTKIQNQKLFNALNFLPKVFEICLELLYGMF